MFLTRRLTARYGKMDYIKDLGKDVYEFCEDFKKNITTLELPNPPEVELLYDFTNQQTIREFDCITDADTGGVSTAELTMSKYGRALFHGNLSSKLLDDEKFDDAGFAAIRSKVRFGRYNKIECHELDERPAAIEIKYRADGRTYNINLQTESIALVDTTRDLLQNIMYTKGGPYWHVHRIPITWFNVTHNGFLQDRQYKFPRIKTVGVSLTDNLTGPFRLEIEYIKLVYTQSMPARFSKKDPYGVVIDKDNDEELVRYTREDRLRLK